MKDNLTLWVLITTMNSWIYRVKKDLLPQLQGVDEVIISHQITNNFTKPEEKKLWENVKYFFMKEKGLSKNRNNTLEKSTTDICHICDDDLNYIKWFEDIIKNEYEKNNFDVITFQAENENWKKHFRLKEWKHNHFSVLKIWSWGITFNKKSLNWNDIKFDKDFWLGSNYPVWEENIFLSDCLKKGLKMHHCNKSIVLHKDESSWIDYREDLIIARIKVFKRLFWFFWWFFWAFYFSIFHYKYYRDKFSIFNFFSLSFKWFLNYLICKSYFIYISWRDFTKWDKIMSSRS